MVSDARTFIDDIDGWNVGVLTVRHDNGWVYTLSIEKGDASLSPPRNYTNCFDSQESAKAAGFEEAKAIIRS